MKKSTLHLTLEKEWFDFIASGKKREEYREIKPYWIRRLMGAWPLFIKSKVLYRGSYEMPFFNDDTITFRNGYAKDARTMVVQWNGLHVDTPNVDWCPKDTPRDKFVFVLKIGEIISKSNF